MIIEKTAKGSELFVKLTGELNVTTARELEAYFKGMPESYDRLVLDFADLSYISSAGLRTVLMLQKMYHDNVVIRNPNEVVMDVFRVTGFLTFLNIESD